MTEIKGIKITYIEGKDISACTYHCNQGWVTPLKIGVGHALIITEVKLKGQRGYEGNPHLSTLAANGGLLSTAFLLSVL